MSIIFSWSIGTLERSLPAGIVMTAHWRLTGTDGTFSGSTYGTQSFDAKDPADPTFVPYDQLTEDHVLQWVHDAMGQDQVAAHLANVTAQIERQKNPTTAAGVPW